MVVAVTAAMTLLPGRRGKITRGKKFLRGRHHPAHSESRTW
jgi:hypothetical protein